MKYAVQISNLSKRYELGLIGSASIRQSLGNLFKRNKASSVKEFWALKNVSLDIKPGEAVGIIGRNGAGKSTLLKLVSQITQPTEGRIRLEGRMSSLLEVGTGFHPELTGRENIFLNGSILGMTRKEIKNKFDEIVDFSGVEKFLDTPVKRYSSGMYVRLAFAVAAHLEPDILVIDEVLSVGDAEFQKKCLGKMNRITSGGNTVLFVSHNLTAVSKLCSRAALIDSGQLIYQGEPTEVISKYLEGVDTTNASSQTSENNRKIRRGSGQVRFHSVQLSDTSGKPKSSFTASEDVLIKLAVHVDQAQKEKLDFSIGFRSGKTQEVILHTKQHKFTSETPNSDGLIQAQIKINGNQLNPGVYYLKYWLGRSGTSHCFDMIDNPSFPLIIREEDDTFLTSPIGYFQLKYEVE